MSDNGNVLVSGCNGNVGNLGIDTGDNLWIRKFLYLKLSRPATNIYSNLYDSWIITHKVGATAFGRNTGTILEIMDDDVQLTNADSELEERNDLYTKPFHRVFLARRLFQLTGYEVSDVWMGKRITFFAGVNVMAKKMHRCSQNGKHSDVNFIYAEDLPEERPCKRQRITYEQDKPNSRS
jgi:hypothetical protein